MEYDSDDTEVLLLIPPDFFNLKEAESDFSARSPADACVSCEVEDIYLTLDAGACSAESDANATNIKNFSMSQHLHLPLMHQNELNKINEQLRHYENNFTYNSELSSNSYPTPTNTSKCKQLSSITHSTPRASIEIHSRMTDKINNDVDIDEFLGESNSYNIGMGMGTNLDTLSTQNYYQMKKIGHTLVDDFNHNSANDQLISLSDLWDVGHKNYNRDSLTVQEERLRRQHCEKMIENLQRKLLEYQQKISVAVEVDKAKDVALHHNENENKNLKERLIKCEEKLNFLEIEKEELLIKLKKDNAELKCNKDCVEKELSQALKMAAKFQDHSDNIEKKFENISRDTNTELLSYKTKIQDLETKISNSERCEEIANEEVYKLRDRLVKSQYDLEKTTRQCTELSTKFATLQNDNQNFIEKLKDEKMRSETMEKKNKNLTQSIMELNQNENKIHKEFETQRRSLKAHYQEQLEKVVEKKLKEFQEQLDKVESNMKIEAKEREHLIAERALKQLRVINDKNEEEIVLLTEKHREEIEVYRCQLINSSKKIDELTEKLNLYKNRRVDIAEKLHDVMETQWQKALEILTNPSPGESRQNDSLKPIVLEKEKLDGVDKFSCPENESFCPRNTEQLQAYIEMLLNKSPRDVDNLHYFLKVSKNGRCFQPKFNPSKPPWK